VFIENILRSANRGGDAEDNTIASKSAANLNDISRASRAEPNQAGGGGVIYSLLSDCWHGHDTHKSSKKYCSEQWNKTIKWQQYNV